MIYEAVFLSAFLKQFEKLSPDLRERVKQGVQLFLRPLSKRVTIRDPLTLLS